MRNRALTNKRRKKTLDIGPKGGLENASKTLGRLKTGDGFKRVSWSL